MRSDGKEEVRSFFVCASHCATLSASTTFFIFLLPDCRRIKIDKLLKRHVCLVLALTYTTKELLGMPARVSGFFVGPVELVRGIGLCLLLLVVDKCITSVRSQRALSRFGQSCLYQMIRIFYLFVIRYQVRFRVSISQIYLLISL